MQRLAVDMDGVLADTYQPHFKSCSSSSIRRLSFLPSTGRISNPWIFILRMVSWSTRLRTSISEMGMWWMILWWSGRHLKNKTQSKRLNKLIRYPFSLTRFITKIIRLLRLSPFQQALNNLKLFSRYHSNNSPWKRNVGPRVKSNVKF